ncbi:hypothetical protein [Empedobacter brevis]|uniref:hypothetical protein n=1 Tax=Empedobacter brevis TaxID=247 RepID=UPI002FE23A1D
MKTSFVILILMTILNSSNPIYIEMKCFKGYIFEQEYNAAWINGITKDRFTPTKEDITKVEEVLKKNLKTINVNIPNQGGKCPIIHKKIKKYNRQYVGYIDTEGNKIIWVNFIWEKNCPENWNKELVDIFDGCSHYWNIKVNLSKEMLFDLSVNGQG